MNKVEKPEWTPSAIEEWVSSQDGADYWYQTIPIRYGIVTPGTVDSRKRFERFDLPHDLRGKSVLDVGCNSGMIALECKRRGASRVVGIDLQRNRLEQARTLAHIMQLDIAFTEMDLLDARRLGQFDLVFCIAVLTEVADLIGGLNALMDVTRHTLYLEIATLETFPRYLPFLTGGVQQLLHLSAADIYAFVSQRLRRKGSRSPLCGTARLRRIDSRLMRGWSLVPNKSLLRSITEEQFRMSDLGISERYNLLRFDRKPDCDK